MLYDGSTSDDNSVENSGAVYIYDKTENKLNASAFIKSPIPEKNELFGSSISLDGNNLAVGASGNSENTGAVYIYNRKNSLWTLEQKLTDPFGSGSDEYGYSVDLDNTTLVVGSPKEDNVVFEILHEECNEGTWHWIVTECNGWECGCRNGMRNNSGAVFIYKKINDVWDFEAYVKASNSEDDFEFGNSVSIDGDILAVGAPGEWFGSHSILEKPVKNGFRRWNQGAVYIYERTNSRWEETAYIKLPNDTVRNNYSMYDSHFGTSVKLSNNTL